MQSSQTRPSEPTSRRGPLLSVAAGCVVAFNTGDVAAVRAEDQPSNRRIGGNAIERLFLQLQDDAV